MDLDPKFPFGWIFPVYPSMIQLDGFWAMDEFGTLLSVMPSTACVFYAPAIMLLDVTAGSQYRLHQSL
jgi:hypothetical protein